MTKISKKQEHDNMRLKMGLPDRWRNDGVRIIPFQASWLVSRRIDRPYPRPTLGQPINELDHRIRYMFDPVAMVQWTLEWLCSGESVMGFLPWRFHPNGPNGQFLIKRQGNDVFGICEAGLTHYVFRPQMIHSYAVPQLYQRPMAAMDMEDFKHLYNRTMYQLDLNARETIVQTISADEQLARWTTLSNSGPVPTQDLKRWGDRVPSERSVMASVVSQQLDFIRRRSRISGLSNKSHFSTYTALKELLQIFDWSSKRLEKSLGPLSYSAARTIFDELAQLRLLVEDDSNFLSPDSFEQVKISFGLACERIYRLVYEKESLFSTADQTR